MRIRIFNIIFSFLGIIALSPIMIIALLLVWLQDFKNPIFLGDRVGKEGKIFKMIKLRTMYVGADKKGIDSTSSNDERITKLGHLIRSYKIDEIFQLFNVLLGQMSLVGPRPNVLRDVILYTEIEKKILNVTPGITDLASIVFSDEGKILEQSLDPDLDYNRLIRPWKSRLAILYINKKSFWLDLQIIYFTIVAVFSKQIAIDWLNKKLIYFKAEENLIVACLRKNKLTPHPPPGVSNIIKHR